MEIMKDITIKYINQVLEDVVIAEMKKVGIQKGKLNKCKKLKPKKH